MMYQGKYASNTKRTTPSKRPKSQKPRRRVTGGTIVFYALYFLVLAALCLGIYFGLGWLNDWLTDYEASQPDTKCQQVFNHLFADPDWGQIYELLDPETIGGESKDSFVAYMEQKVGDSQITYSKTSAGLTGGRKYILRIGEENLGTFTLSNSVTGDLEIPDWKLDTVEIFVSSREHVTIFTQQSNTVTVNGTVLDDSYIIRTTSTLAEDYLPEDIHGMRTATYYVDDLLITPQVVVTDPSGNTVSMSYNAETKTYTEPVVVETYEISNEEYDFILDATKVYLSYMLRDTSASKLQSYFDKSSSCYKTIVKNDQSWLQSYLGYSFSQESITNYCRYGENLFSARIVIDLNVTRTKGTIKTFSLDTTFFVEKNGSSWKIIEMTNVDVQQELTQVRMTYMCDGQMLSSEMLSTAVTTLTPPSVDVPQGKTFSGWFLESVDDNGDTTYTLVFQPSDNGNVYLPTGYTLEPMVLHALFE